MTPQPQFKPGEQVLWYRITPPRGPLVAVYVSDYGRERAVIEVANAHGMRTQRYVPKEQLSRPKGDA